MNTEIRLAALRTIPDVRCGDDLAELITSAAAREKVPLDEDCIIVVAQKIVSKAEGRVVSLCGIRPSALAESYAREHGKDPRVIELALQQARRVVKMDRGVLIVETHHGFVCANGGVDVSNVSEPDSAALLPVDPDASAARICEGLRRITGYDCGVIISDTFGRPWREGLVNVALGVAAVAPLADLRGRLDRSGRPLQATVIATADELAAAAGLLMRKDAGTPVVLIYGTQIQPGAGDARQLIRRPQSDLFR